MKSLMEGWMVRRKEKKEKEKEDNKQKDPGATVRCWISFFGRTLLPSAVLPSSYHSLTYFFRVNISSSTTTTKPSSPI